MKKLSPESKAIILKAAEIVDRGWTQGEFARDDKGDYCSALDEFAACHCTAGAMSRARADLYGIGHTSDHDSYQHYREAHHRVEKELGVPIPNWNDKPERTKEQVVSALTKIANGEKL